MVMGFKHQPIRSMVCVVGLQPTRLTPPHFECGMFSNFITRRYYLKPTSCLIAISSIGSWMMSFCPYITFTIVSLCQWNTIASYGKCLLVIRRCLKLYPVSMPVRCDIDLTVIFKSCRALYCLSIPIPFIMPNRLTGAPYLALGNYAIHAYLICLTHVPYIMMAVHQTPFNYSSCVPSFVASRLQRT